MKIKPRTYYKCYYKCYYVNDLYEYDIMYTGTKRIYEIAYKHINEPLFKWDKKIYRGSITQFQDSVNISAYNKIEELSKEDLFLELL